MIGLLGRLFGSDKAFSKVADHAAAGLDKLIYTDEEKSDVVAADRSEARQMLIEWLRHTQGQNLARRVIAFMIAGVWLMQFMAAQLLAIYSTWADPEILDKLRETATILSDNANQMNGAMMLLLGFYFAAPHLDKIISPAMQKFGKTK